MGTDERRQVHNEFVLARLELHHVTRLCIGNGLGIERTQGVEHVHTTPLVIFERHLADTAINAHLAHAVDVAAELKKCIEIALWHRTRQLKTGPAGDLANNREFHSYAGVFYSAALSAVASDSVAVIYAASATMSSTSALACSTIS